MSRPLTFVFALASLLPSAIAGNPDPIHQFEPSSVQGLDRWYGRAVDIDDGVALVGGPGGQSYYHGYVDAIDIGTGHILKRLRDSPSQPGQEFGAAVALDGNIVATAGTAMHLAQHDIVCQRINKVREGRPHIVDMIKSDEICLIVNTTEGKRATRESKGIRAAAVVNKVTYYTTIAAAAATCTALDYLEAQEVNKLQDLHDEIAA